MAQQGQEARAIYDYEARASDELSFKRHDIITVLSRDEEDEGWYNGVLHGKTGLFPNNYVQFLEPAKPSAAAGKDAQKPMASPSREPPTVPDYISTETLEKSYTLAETLGRGRFSQVRRCTQVPGGRACAIKIMDLGDPELGATAEDAEREVLAEVEVLRSVQHPNIVQLLETLKNGIKYYLVLEDLSGGDLFDRIEQNGPFREDDAGPLIRQLLTAVAYLHERGVVHRDIKPDNLVFVSRQPDSPIKLIDFGYAGYCSDAQQLRGLCGTPDYAAPEILSWYTADKAIKPKGTPLHSQPVRVTARLPLMGFTKCGIDFYCTLTRRDGRMSA